ncbi:hypothetical protein SLEP1_g42125 [Rubroshorea leprosula]|uniref:Isoamylase 1-3-like C-terminal domain-containing protein n=1 Tax=Rubroshorea leprosula TaxID=152421 RepID=A0AAV5L989_9ROSI|nr:hypothetical protein SLEP1_g42125 [Rubroshorea leprosula]
MKGSFATCVAGSADLYMVNKCRPYHSINFVSVHDGFTLYNLVSYTFKHNDANGEGGNDGTPMMLMGDEYGHTRYGNNNSYGHDTAINNFQWKQSDATWHEDNWGTILTANFSLLRKALLSFLLQDSSGDDVYLAFNAHDYFVKAQIPSPPPNRHWFRVADTNLASPDDFVPGGVPSIGSSRSTYNIAPYSSIVLEAK